MRDSGVDVLLVTYNRAAYTRLSLPRLLETADENTRVWLWHNGTDEETLSVVRSHSEHPRVYRFHHSVENVKLTEPTNWILREGRAEYFAKVDDDCLVPDQWINTLRRAHEAEPRFGAIGCWHFMEDDFDEAVCRHKIQEFGGGQSIIRHPWIGGSGFLMKRRCVEETGFIDPRHRGITGYFTRAALKGWINGWYLPLLVQEHMDDPRAPNTMLKTDEDMLRCMPLSSSRTGARTVADWDRQLRNSAAELQRLPSNAAYYHPWLAAGRRLLGRIGLPRLGR